VLDQLEAHHEVLAITLPGHHGGPMLETTAEVSVADLTDGVERALDAAGIDTAHIAGNSLGGWITLELARRGRARSVVVLSPAGGWRSSHDLRRALRQITAGHKLMQHRDRLGLPGLLRRPRFRRLALRSVMERGERVPAGEAAILVEDAVGCLVMDGVVSWLQSAPPLAPWTEPVDYPIRIAWARYDRTIPFERFGRHFLDAIPQAEHVTLDGVGHVPMYDDPALIADTILSLIRKADHSRRSTMSSAPDIEIAGKRGKVVVRRWETANPRRVVVLAHGYGEHSGRYEHVAQRLVDDGAFVYAPDHHGHGRSDGERAVIEDVEDLVDDVAAVVAIAREEHPGLPVALLGHSLGGIIATRFVQRGNHGLSALVLSGPVIGGNPEIEGLLELDPIPEVPIDPAMLSRDPAVGEAYASDPLVYHGPFARTTLEAIFGAVKKIAAGPDLDGLPTLWIHGEEDPLAPLAPTRVAIDAIRGAKLEEQIYPEARHEVLNETNREDVLDEVAGFLDDVQPTVAAA
jgi:alpha-beta hydrolase superfamily lysophospholipase